MRRYIILSILIWLALGVVVFADARTLELLAGDDLTVTAADGARLLLDGTEVPGVHVVAEALPTVEPPTATPEPPTPVPPTPTPDGAAAVGVCGESMASWHPPVVNGCATGHEHGDQPPSWVSAAGYTVLYHFPGNTSAAENTLKHVAMKGFTARFNNQDVYFRIHAASNPGDRSARYHSFELYLRDTSGAVSHITGWYNTGDPRPSTQGGARFVRRAGSEPTQRPIMLIPDATSIQQGITCEQWYSQPGQAPWYPDFGWTICAGTTLYAPDENDTPYDVPDNLKTGSRGLTRRLELAWDANRSGQRGTFTSDQFGGQVNTCVAGTPVTKFGVSYTTICLQQHIAPTLGTIQFPNNAIQKQFPGQGVTWPN